jgi:hypothetical protein
LGQHDDQLPKNPPPPQTTQKSLQIDRGPLEKNPIKEARNNYNIILIILGVMVFELIYWPKWMENEAVHCRMYPWQYDQKGAVGL